MCGICGFVGAPDQGVLATMTDSMTHRGPDEVGYWSSDGVSLGMRRLAIVDLSSGQQPVSNEDGTIWVIFNGEIYNHPELRVELEAAGHRFRSHHSDTETLVHLYEEHGPDYLHKLNGMFGIALWDSRRGELHLARDRAGVKPLFYSRQPGLFLFGSEIKAILAHPAVRRRPNFEALHHYFTFKNTPSPHSAFEGIQQLRAGERAVWSKQGLCVSRWWRLRYEEDPAIGEEQAAARVRELLTDSVRLRMRADVEFGAYLSGGVDSSSVVALMAALGARRVKTFALVYEDGFAYKDADRVAARRMADLCDTDHYEHVMTSGELADSTDEVLSAFDEPYSGVTSTYFLTRLIGRHVKVALSGDGADELFASYLPHRLAQPLHDRAPGHESILARGDEAARRMGQYLWDEAGKQELYSDQMRDLVGSASTEAHVRDLYGQAGTNDPLNRALFVDFESLLPDQVLAFVDRLSMAHSVEVRPPFLDYRIVEYAATLPGRMKIKQGRVKHILKEAVRGLIPDEVIDRPKEGFVLPINQWLLAGLGERAKETLAPERLRRHGLLCPDAVGRVLAAPERNGARIWNLFMFQSWWERFLG